jgi:hypothetical protein
MTRGKRTWSMSEGSTPQQRVTSSQRAVGGCVHTARRGTSQRRNIAQITVLAQTSETRLVDEKGRQTRYAENGVVGISTQGDPHTKQTAETKRGQRVWSMR